MEESIYRMVAFTVIKWLTTLCTCYMQPLRKRKAAPVWFPLPHSTDGATLRFKLAEVVDTEALPFLLKVQQ